MSSAILITLACVLAPLSVTAVWANRELSNTDQYVTTVAPIADDPAVQSALANKVTTVAFDNLDVQAVANRALKALAQRPNIPPRVAAVLPGLAVPIANGVQSFTRSEVNKFFAGPKFPQVWEQVNRAAHTQIDNLLKGNQGGALSAQGNTITLNLAPIVAQVKQRLVARGLTLANKIPTVNQSFVLVQSTAITKAQSYYSLLNTLGFWLPGIALVLFVAGVLLARNRRRGLLKGAFGVAGAMAVLAVALALARNWYVNATPANVLTAQAAGDVFDTMVRFLRTALRATAVLALIVALAVFLTGPSSAAVRTRSTFKGGIGSLRGNAESAGLNTGPVGTWTFAHKRALQIAAIIAGGLAVAFWTQPTGGVIVGIGLAVVLLLALIEFLGRPPVKAAAVPPSAAQTPSVPQQRTRTSTDQTEPVPTAPNGGDKTKPTA